MEDRSMDKLKQQLVDFFIEMLDYRQFFKKKLYADAFQKCYEEYRGLLAEIIEVCGKAEDKDETIDRLADAIPEYVHGQISAQKGKSKKEGLMIDYNMTMVTFVMPVLGYNENEYCIKLVDKMVEKWNQPPVTMKIQKSDFDSLKNGFKSHPCYITTAVCASRHQADNCYELNLLRDYRDHYLSATDEGAQIVEQYYNIAPTIVNRINRNNSAARIYDEIYREYISPCVHLIETGQLEECRKLYTAMVEELENKYLFS